MKTLRSKLLLLIIPIFIVSLSVIAYINHYKAQEFLTTNFQEEAANKLTFIQGRVDDWVQDKMNIITTMANSDEVNGHIPQKQIDFFMKQLQAHHDFEMFFVSNNGTGKNVVTSMGKAVDISDRPYFNIIPKEVSHF
ncbi:hypothetical protein [Aneurinibacillus terranovensis]|uniref:hypothetical protein n=1 Tax=Aneurinibacillus terranovensis TaxID=278991 RepID=UPI00040D2434|nr:hypothetical protein [Aneurinibacillus terranovensis]